MTAVSEHTVSKYVACALCVQDFARDALADVPKSAVDLR